MDNELFEIRKTIKDKRKTATIGLKSIKKSTSIKWFKYLNKLFIAVVLMLLTLIILKNNEDLKASFYKHVFDYNISFASINKLYQDKFGSPLPFQNLFKGKTTTVFNEKLNYSESSKYKNGVKLVVEDKYLVPVLETGIVIFIGEKKGYGNTVIIQQVDGMDVWYSNIDNLNVKLYDYIEKGTLLGEAKDNNLYLVYMKDGKVLDYQDYI